MLLAQAKSYIKKPKAGGAARPLYLEQPRQNPRKRARTQEPDDDEPGMSLPPPLGNLIVLKIKKNYIGML
jgi:hypothetical protein